MTVSGTSRPPFPWFHGALHPALTPLEPATDTPEQGAGADCSSGQCSALNPAVFAGLSTPACLSPKGETFVLLKCD